MLPPDMLAYTASSGEPLITVESGWTRSDDSGNKWYSPLNFMTIGRDGRIPWRLAGKSRTASIFSGLIPGRRITPGTKVLPGRTLISLGSTWPPTSGIAAGLGSAEAIVGID